MKIVGFKSLLAYSAVLSSALLVGCGQDAQETEHSSYTPSIIMMTTEEGNVYTVVDEVVDSEERLEQLLADNKLEWQKVAETDFEDANDIIGMQELTEEEIQAELNQVEIAEMEMESEDAQLIAGAAQFTMVAAKRGGDRADTRPPRGGRKDRNAPPPVVRDRGPGPKPPAVAPPSGPRKNAYKRGYKNGRKDQRKYKNRGKKQYNRGYRDGRYDQRKRARKKYNRRYRGKYYPPKRYRPYGRNHCGRYVYRPYGGKRRCYRPYHKRYYYNPFRWIFGYNSYGYGYGSHGYGSSGAYFGVYF